MGIVRFLYFLEFWMVFVSYFPNFLWSPFLKFFRYFFQKCKCLFISEKSQCFSLFKHCYCLIIEFDLIKPSAFWHLFLKITTILIIHSLVVKTSFLMIEKFNGSWFLMIEEFDGSFLIRAFLIRAFLIERECGT